MKVKIGNAIIPDATVKRYIHFESGLPLSMVKISFVKKNINTDELYAAFDKHPKPILPFECDILKTRVLVRGFGYLENKDYFILQEPASDVNCGYKLMDWTQPTGNPKMVFLVPDNVKDLVDPLEFSLFPCRRFILRKDIPDDWFKPKNI